MSILIPTEQTDTSTGGWEKLAFPGSMTSEQQLKEFENIFNSYGKRVKSLEDKINDINGKIDSSQDELKKQPIKNIEIIGIFSAVLALIIIDVNIIKSAPNFLSAILLIIALTCSMTIFAILIHTLFATDDKKIGKSFWIPVGVLIALIILGGGLYYWKKDLYWEQTRQNNQPICTQSQNNIIATSSEAIR